MKIDDMTGRLARLDTPAVSDALDTLGLTGVVAGLAPLSCVRRIVGKVLTVKLGPDDRTSQSRRHLCAAAVEAAGPGDVIVIEQRTGIAAAGWGGILSTAASVKGIAGVVVDGPVRDVDESRDLEFPVFARNAVPTTARGRIREEAWNVPVTIGDVSVAPGDFVIADSSGVVFLPNDLAEAILETAEAIAAREAAMTKAVRSGEPVGTVMGADYETMVNRK
jgi:4-hydroxy-4-methyl-2-oxoglutarate aldolase